MPTPPQQLQTKELASELIALRQQAEAIREREEILRDEMLSRLQETPERRFSSEDFDFTFVPASTTQKLSEPLLRQQLENLGLPAEAVDLALEASAKPGTRNAYLRITPKRKPTSTG